MPTYEYACSSCKHEWELEQSIKEAAITECPSCHQATAKRQISRGTGFILKGGGWYADLYSSPSGGKPAEKPADKTSEKPAADGKAESSATKSDTGSSSTTDSSTTSTSAATA
jgi:putative FmdB family regulatory protein